eukprot:1139978-Pelagomonas_calceolata.AAC.4
MQGPKYVWLMYRQQRKVHERKVRQRLTGPGKSGSCKAAGALPRSKKVKDVQEVSEKVEFSASFRSLSSHAL